MRSTTIRKLAWTLGLLALAYAALPQVLGWLHSDLRGVYESPNGEFRIYAFHVTLDGVAEHAPYGDVLSLTRHSRLLQPNDGYVIFAGHCRQGVLPEWKGNDRIVVRCGSREGIRTLAVLAYGIAIEMNAPEHRPPAR